MSNEMPERVSLETSTLSPRLARLSQTDWGDPRKEYLRADLHTTKLASLEAKLAALVNEVSSLQCLADDARPLITGELPSIVDGLEGTASFTGPAMRWLSHYDILRNAKQAALETKGG